MGSIERKKRQREEVRSSILNTAWNMVQEEGWQSLSIRKIADAIEYSVPVIYDHFENKEAILQAFGIKGFELLYKKMHQAKEKHTEPAEQLKAMAGAYWSFAIKNKAHYQLMYGVGMASCEGQKSLPVKNSYKELVKDSITEILARTKQPDTNVCLKFQTFWSILHGLVSIRITGNSEVSDAMDKLVLEDAITGFIKNLS